MSPFYPRTVDANADSSKQKRKLRLDKNRSGGGTTMPAHPAAISGSSGRARWPRRALLASGAQRSALKPTLK